MYFTNSADKSGVACLSRPHSLRPTSLSPNVFTSRALASPSPRAPESTRPHVTRPRVPSPQLPHPRATFSHSRLLVSLRKCFHRKNSFSRLQKVSRAILNSPIQMVAFGGCPTSSVNSWSKGQVSRDSIWQIIKQSMAKIEGFTLNFCTISGFPRFSARFRFSKYERGHVFFVKYESRAPSSENHKRISIRSISRL